MKRILLQIVFILGILSQAFPQSPLDSPFQIPLNEEMSLGTERSVKDDIETNKLILYNKITDKTIVLDENTFTHGDAWKFTEARGEIPFGYYQIAGALLDGKDIYVALGKFGTTTLYECHFTDTDIYTIKSKPIKEFFITPAYGNISNVAQMKKINEDIYMLLCTGQTYNRGEIALLKIQPKTLNIKEIKFEKKTKLLAGIYLSDEAKEHTIRYMEQEERRKEYGGSPNIELEQRFSRMKEYFDIPFRFRELDSDYSRRQKQINDISNDWLRLYPFFDKELDPRQEPDMTKSEEMIKDALAFFGQDTNIKLLDFFSDFSSGGLAYFFYLDNKNKLQIIRYQKGSNSMWILGDYKETSPEK